MQNIPELIDYSIIIIMLVSLLMGIVRGLMCEVMSLITWSAAFMLAISYCKRLSGVFNNIIPEAGIRIVIAFILTVFVVLIIGRIITRAIEKIIQSTQFTITDRITGCVFGFIRGFAIITVTLVMLKSTGIIQNYVVKGSTLISKFGYSASWLETKLPDDIKKINLKLPKIPLAPDSPNLELDMDKISGQSKQLENINSNETIEEQLKKMINDKSLLDELQKNNKK